MSALAALLLVVPLAALHPYERAETLASIRTRDEAAVKQQSPPSVPSQPSAPSLPSTAPSPMWSPSPMTMASPVSPLSPTSTSGAYEALGAGVAKTAAQLAKTKLTTSPRTCDDPVVPGTTINSIHANESDDGSSSFRYLSLREDGDCIEATLLGRVQFTDAEDDVRSMPVTARAVFRERARGEDREIVIRSADDGSITHILKLNGRPVPYDDAARRWFAGFLPGILREGAIDVKPRIVRLRAQSGVDGVLKMIETIHSSGAKREHYEALLSEGGLSGDDIDRIVRHAGRNLPSSGDLRSVLTKAAPSMRGGARSASAIEQAVLAVSSSGDRTAVLRAFAQTSDRDNLLSVMRVAETIPSSGDKASLLQTVAPSYLDRNDDALRDAFFRTLSTVTSSGDMRSVLTGSVMGYAAANEKVAFAVASAVAAIPSSGDRLSVLLALVNVRAIRSTRIRDAYLRATEGMASGDATRALRAVAVDRY